MKSVVAKTSWTKMGAIALMVVMVVNIALAAGYFLQKRYLQNVSQHAKGGDRIVPISGIDVNNAAWKSGDSKCHLVRITSDDCQYCRKDRPSYDRLASAALQSSCEVIEVAPMAGMMSPDARPGIVQMKYLSAELGPAVYPFATPQTVVVDRDWNIVFARRGTFNEASLKDAIGVVQYLAKRAE